MYPNRSHSPLLFADIYVSVTSFVHQIAAQGKWVAVVSARVETGKPHDELIPALRLLGKIDKEYVFGLMMHSRGCVSFVLCGSDRARLLAIWVHADSSGSAMSMSPPEMARQTMSSSLRPSTRRPTSSPPLTTSSTCTCGLPVRCLTCPARCRRTCRTLTISNNGGCLNISHAAPLSPSAAAAVCACSTCFTNIISPID